MRKYLYPLTMVALAAAGAAAILGFAKTAQAQAEETVAVPVPASRMQACMQGGGCALITREEYIGAMREAYAAGVESTKGKCVSKSI